MDSLAFSQPTFSLSDVAPTRAAGAQVAAIPVLPAEGDADSVQLGPGAIELLEEVDLDLFAVLEVAGANGRAGQITSVPVAGAPGLASSGLALVLLVGVGAGEPADLRRAGAALARAVTDRSTLATSVPAVGDDAGLRAFVEGMVLGSFRYTLSSKAPDHRPVERVVICADPDRGEILATALAVARAAWRSRTLATVPSNLKNPAWLVDRARELAEEAGLDIEVLDDTELVERGFGGLSAVGRASATPPRLAILRYHPKGSRKSTPHVVLAGKGITFDTGGLSIKPGQGMVTMKRDMSGAGAVLSAMAALADVGCQVKVTGLLALAENAIGGDALRPGDVITHYGGRTTEVTNTDAEGRLVLGDCLAYAAKELDPDLLVDVATLTGAVKVALGQRIGGIFASSDSLCADLISAGAAAGEPLWRMPLAEVYEEKLSSKVADSDNATNAAQAITAALFLQHFTAGLPWAHLDLASVGDAVADEYEWTPGPTGYGARALLYWLEEAHLAKR